MTVFGGSTPTGKPTIDLPAYTEGVIEILFIKEGILKMKRTRIPSILLSLCIIVMCMVGMSVSASADTSLSDCEVWVDVYEQFVTVLVGDENVPEDSYSVIFFSFAPTEGGESPERIGEEFPTAPGTYIAAVVANEGSEYTGENRSEPFTVELDSYEEENEHSTGEDEIPDLSDSIVYVTAESQNVTVRLHGGLVSEENYHVIFFTYEEIEGGESLVRAGTEFPTEPGTYIAAIVANESSEFFGENRSDPFTIETTEAAEETNPRTGAELPGLAVLAISAAVVSFTAKRKL